jgi:hypothetical protein
MNHNRDANFLSVPNGVFGASFAVWRNEGMENVRVFGNQTITGIKCLSENVTG